MEIAIQDRDANPPGPILCLRGWPDNRFRGPMPAGSSAGEPHPAVTYQARIGADAWTCQCGFRLPLRIHATHHADDRLQPQYAQRGPEYLANLEQSRAATPTTSATEARWSFASEADALADKVKDGLAVWLDAADASTVQTDESGRFRGGKTRPHCRDAVQPSARFRPLFGAQRLQRQADAEVRRRGPDADAGK